MAETLSRSTIQLYLLSPEKNLYSGEVLSIIVPGEEGSLGIYPNHAPLVAAMGVGILQIRLVDGKILRFAVDGGFVEVKKGIVNILADGADSPETIDIAKQEKLLEEWKKAKPSLEKIQAIKKAKIRISLKQN